MNTVAGSDWNSFSLGAIVAVIITVIFNMIRDKAEHRRDVALDVAELLDVPAAKISSILSMYRSLYGSTRSSPLEESHESSTITDILLELQRVFPVYSPGTRTYTKMLLVYGIMSSEYDDFAQLIDGYRYLAGQLIKMEPSEWATKSEDFYLRDSDLNASRIKLNCSLASRAQPGAVFKDLVVGYYAASIKQVLKWWKALKYFMHLKRGNDK